MQAMREIIDALSKEEEGEEEGEDNVLLKHAVCRLYLALIC